MKAENNKQKRKLNRKNTYLSDAIKKKVCEYDKIKALAARGLSLDQIGVALGLSKSSFQRYRAKDKKVAEAYIEGKQLGVGKVANALYTAATLGKNVNAMIFYLKIKGKWKEPKDKDKKEDKKNNSYTIINLPDNGRRTPTE